MRKHFHNPQYNSPAGSGSVTGTKSQKVKATYFDLKYKHFQKHLVSDFIFLLRLDVKTRQTGDGPAQQVQIEGRDALCSPSDL